MIQFNIDELIKQYGPSVVAAAQKQVSVTVAQDIFWGALGAAALIFAIWAARKEVTYWSNPKKDSYDDAEPIMVILGIAGGLAAIAGFILLISAGGEAWTYAANPEYATLKVLRGLVGK